MRFHQNSMICLSNNVRKIFYQNTLKGILESQLLCVTGYHMMFVAISQIDFNMFILHLTKHHQGHLVLQRWRYVFILCS